MASTETVGGEFIRFPVRDNGIDIKQVIANTKVGIHHRMGPTTTKGEEAFLFDLTPGKKVYSGLNRYGMPTEDFLTAQEYLETTMGVLVGQGFNRGVRNDEGWKDIPGNISVHTVAYPSVFFNIVRMHFLEKTYYQDGKELYTEFWSRPTHVRGNLRLLKP